MLSVATLQTDHSAALTDFIAAWGKEALVPFAKRTVRAKNEQLKAQVAALTSTEDAVRLHLAAALSFFFSSAAPVSLQGERNGYLGLSRSLAGKLDPADNGFTNILASARNSCSTLCGGVSSLRDVFFVGADNNGVIERVPIPHLIE